MNSDRTILHIDLNNFYASVECLYQPELKAVPMAVCGDQEERHGIVLAKNNLAKALGIKTAEPIWQAKKKAPNLVTVPPNFKRYLKYSKLVRQIFVDYTDQMEAFSIDEAWLDVTGSKTLFGDGVEIAELIRQRVKGELGLTVSIGVSFNKIFAKLGSDMKKPDAVTVITRENYQDVVWSLPVRELLFVGKKTAEKLNNRAIFTIGDLAKSDVKMLKRMLGVWGQTIWCYANGYDDAPVRKLEDENLVKSVSNGTTTSRDMTTLDELKIIVYVLAESVAERLRKLGLKCSVVEITVKDNTLFSSNRQVKLENPTYVSNKIAETALALFRKNYTFAKPIRSISIAGNDLVAEDSVVQLDLFAKENKADKEKLEGLEKTIDAIRGKYGRDSINRAMLMQNDGLSTFKPKGE